MSEEKDLVKNEKKVEKYEVKQSSGKKKGLVAGAVAGSAVALALGLGLGLGLQKPKVYDLSTNEISQESGTIILSNTTAKKGEIVEVIVDIEEGYKLKNLYYMIDGDTTKYEIKKVDGKYTFEMPKGDITVYADIEEATVVLNLNINGQEVVEYAIYGDTLAETLKYSDINDYTTCGFYLDENFSIPFDSQTVMKEEVNLYTKKATLDSLSFSFNYDNDSFTVVAEHGTNIVVPKYYKESDLDEGYPVIALGGFSSEVKSIILPYGIENIAEGDRYQSAGSLALEEVFLPSTVKTIGRYAFNGTLFLSNLQTNSDGIYTCSDGKKIAISAPSNITSVDLTGVRVIAIEAFSYCNSLTEVIIPSDIEVIRESAFFSTPFLNDLRTNSNGIYTCSDGKKILLWSSDQETVDLSGVVLIADKAFESCPSITTIEVDSENEYFTTEDGILYSKDKTSLIYYPLGKEETSFEVPAYVKSIAKSAFYNNTNLESITFDEGSNLINIDSYAFYNSKISSITLPSSLVYIGHSAFKYCKNLTKITIPKNVRKMGNSVFYWCTNLKEVHFDNNTGLRHIGQHSYEGCSNLAKFTVPSGIESVGYYSFNGCWKLTEIYNLSQLNLQKGSWNYEGLGAYATDIYNDIKDETKIVDINGFKMYEDAENGVYYCFGYEGEEIELTLPTTEYNYEIYQYAFSDNDDIIKVIIPECVTAIGVEAFANCNNLRSITIPSSIKEIKDEAFRYCYGLFEVYNFSELEIVKGSTNGYVGNYALDIYTTEAESKIVEIDGFLMYENASKNKYYCLGYKGNESEITLPTTEYNYEIYKYSFMQNMNITSVNIPDCVTAIGKWAFRACENLEEINIPTSVKSIGERTFEDCFALYSITLPESITKIETKTFYGCYSLMEVTLPSTIESIGSYAFYGCEMLSEITLPSNITNIADYTFYSCYELIEITIPASVTTIGSYAFAECLSLESVIFEEGSQLISIDSYAFANCGTLTDVILPTKLTSIGSYAFYYCSSLTSINIPTNVTIINAYTFYNCSLESITIPVTVTSIGDYAFYSCNLTSITIPSAVSSIGYCAFSSCTSLTSVTFEDTEGWYVASSATATSGTNLTSTDLGDTSTAATYLTSTYSYRYWINA